MGATLSWAFKLRLDQITAVAIETAMQVYNIFIVIITIFVITLLLEFSSSFNSSAFRCVLAKQLILRGDGRLEFGCFLGKSPKGVGGNF